MDKYSFLLRSNTASPLVVMCACVVLTSSQFTSNSISFSDMNSSCCVVLTSIAAISLYQVVTRGLPPRYWNNCRPSFACATHSNRVRWCRAPCSVHIHKRVVDHSVMYEWKQITCLVNGTLVAILNIFNIDSSSTTNFEARQSLIVVFIFLSFVFVSKRQWFAMRLNLPLSLGILCMFAITAQAEFEEFFKWKQITYAPLQSGTLNSI